MRKAIEAEYCGARYRGEYWLAANKVTWDVRVTRFGASQSIGGMLIAPSDLRAERAVREAIEREIERLQW